MRHPRKPAVGESYCTGYENIFKSGGKGFGLTHRHLKQNNIPKEKKIHTHKDQKIVAKQRQMEIIIQ